MDISNQKEIYTYLKTILPSNYVIWGDDIKEIALVNGITIPTEKACAIYFKSASNPQRVVAGSYIQKSLRVTFNIFGDRKDNDSAKLFGEQSIETISNILNKKLNNVRLIKFNLQGNLNFVGKNQQGVPVYSINWIMEYS